MRYKQTGLALICFLSAAMRLYTQPYIERFDKANQYYHDGQYEEALSEYLGILENNTISGNILYNTANTYYKLGHIGYALLYYERAKRYIPNDEDLSENIHFMKSLIHDSIPTDAHSGLARIYHHLRNIFGWKIWLSMIGLMYLAAMICVGMSIYFSRYRYHLLLFSSILSMLILVFSFIAWDNYRLKNMIKKGIIVIPEVDVRYSPSYEGAIAFKLHEGASMQVIRTVDTWHQIRLSKGKNGWVPDAALEKI